MERFKEFGEFLKYKRKEMKVTVRELAFTLNTRASRITEYENGSRRPPDGDFLPELADALELNQSEKDLMYDLAGKSRGTVPQDIAYYIMDKGYIYDALRSAMRSNAGEKEWRSVRDAFSWVSPLNIYDVDGGFGDAVSVKERICSFNNRADAEKFIEKYGCEHAYDHPFADLYCGKLTIIKEKTITFEEAEKLVENAWWREKKGE